MCVMPIIKLTSQQHFLPAGFDIKEGVQVMSARVPMAVATEAHPPPLLTSDCTAKDLDTTA